MKALERQHLKDDHGPFDIIGDVHGCADELEDLLLLLGYELKTTGKRGKRKVKLRHAKGRRLIFVGDLVDRGPANMDVLRLVMRAVKDEQAYCVIGNHDDKFLRWLKGRNVQVSKSLKTSVVEMKQESAKFRAKVLEFLDNLPSQLILDHGKLVIAHAGMPEPWQGVENKRTRTFAMYGEVTGKKDGDGYPVRANWARHYSGKATVIHGHVARKRVRKENKVWAIDTGCVYGGKLTAVRWPEKKTVQVQARKAWFDHPRWR